MFFSAFKNTSATLLATKMRSLALVLIAGAICLSHAEYAQAKTRATKANVTETSGELPNPDMLLIEVYQNLANNKLQAAHRSVSPFSTRLPDPWRSAFDAFTPGYVVWCCTEYSARKTQRNAR